MQIFWFSCAPSVTGYRSNLIFAFVCIFYFSASTHDFRAALFMGRPSPTKSPDTKHDFRQQAAARLRAETGTIYKRGQTRVALLKPSTYFVSMSSLGFQQIYRILNDMPDVVAERAFLPDDPEAFVRSRSSLFTYESGLAVGDCEIIGVSIAYELEITGLLRCLELSGVPLWASERSDSDPIVMLGGPLTFSNPLPASPFADVVLMGEARRLSDQSGRSLPSSVKQGWFFGSGRAISRRVCAVDPRRAIGRGRKSARRNFTRLFDHSHG